MDGWWLTKYRPSWLRDDVVAGLSTAAVVVPQSMAYAGIAGLPVEVGLYTATVPMAAYALSGTSRALSVSVSSSIAAVTAVAVAGTPDPLAAASTLALFSGIVLLLAGWCRLGFVAQLISAPVLLGFKVGIGITIAVGQVDDLLGVEVEGDRVSEQLWSALGHLPDAHLPTLAVSAVCVAALLAGKRWVPAVPAAIVVVAGAIAATAAFGLEDHGIALIDAVPSGFPPFTLPTLDGSSSLIGPAIGIALVAFVESIAAARTFQAADDRPVDADRELSGLGAANLASSVFSGMPAGGGMSQTAVNDGAGARSPMAAVVTATTVLVTLVLLAPAFSDLPQAALGALVFVAAIGLVDVGTLRKVFAVHRRDGLLALVAAAFVIATGALDGILAAVLLSSLTLLYETSRRPVEVVREVPDAEAVHRPVPPGMLVIRPHSDLYFANAQHFRSEVDAAIDAERAAGTSPSVVVLDTRSLSLYEFTAHQALRTLHDDLARRGITMEFVLSEHQRHGAAARFRRVFGATEITAHASLDEAVRAFRSG